VFSTLDAGLAWAAEHQVNGMLAEYPHGGAYDVAVSEGRFTPSKAHHGTAQHVSNGYFTAAYGPSPAPQSAALRWYIPTEATLAG
jgi:hypothetical protein